MFETGFPPLCGVLAAKADRAKIERWQKVLAGLSQPEGLLAMAQGLASLATGLEGQPRQDLLVLLLAVLVNQAQGSSYLPLGQPGRMKELLDPFEAGPMDWQALLQRKEIEPLWNGPGAPLRLEDDCLYSGRFLAPEVQLAEQARARSGRTVSQRKPFPAALLAPDKLSEEQCAAVAAALQGGLTLVTGGPGTGKTSIILAMLRSLVSGSELMAPGDIRLAAPTGKAAQRMIGSIRDKLRDLGERQPLGQEEAGLGQMAPETLHRLLGWNHASGRFRHDRANPLVGKVVIVDEASMIGLELMNALFAAVPEEAALVLLGDAHQLPSVEAGRAFRDLAAALPVQLLTHSYRMDPKDVQGRQILTAAQAINEGNIEGFWKANPEIARRERFDEWTGLGLEVLAPTAGNLASFFAQWVEKSLWRVDGGKEGETTLGALAFPPLNHTGRDGPFRAEDLARVRRVLDHYDQVRVLCPVNLGASLRSVDSLNAFFHGQMVALAMSTGGLELAGPKVAGEPVMVRHNDYARGIYNGDQGVVMLVRRGVEVHREVFFPNGDGFLNFPLAAIQEELDLCYAITVHKAQGSEFERIALVLPERSGPLLTREILYTAMTRARKTVTILGTADVLEDSIGKPVLRWSRLAWRIKAAGDSKGTD